MTPIELKAYNIIRDAGEFTGPAALGYCLWPEGGSHRRPQGMALAAGKVVSRLRKAGYVYNVLNLGQSTFAVTQKPL